MPHVVIVGGGLSGLAVAYRLTGVVPGVAVTLLESRDRPGGNIGTSAAATSTRRSSPVPAVRRQTFTVATHAHVEST